MDKNVVNGIDKKCFKCCGVYPHFGESSCLAMGAECIRFEKMNHLESYL